MSVFIRYGKGSAHGRSIITKNCPGDGTVKWTAWNRTWKYDRICYRYISTG